MDRVQELILLLRTSNEEERETIKAELRALITGIQGREARGLVERAIKSETLEIRWELEEVLEAVTPKPPPKPAEPVEPKKPEPPPADPQAGKRLRASDLVVVYDDPRGLVIHRTKDGKRWFATQADPRTGKPQTFELVPEEVSALQEQLAGSPYWTINATDTLL